MYIPAAVYAKDHSGLGAYIKYGRPKGYNGNSITVANQSPWWKHILCSDRELLIVKDGYKTNQIRPLDDNWDEFVSWSQFHPTANGFQDGTYMVNYAQHFMESSDFNFNMAQTMPYGSKRHFKYIADSGGFQIFKDRVDFISPADAAVWYHNNVDLGVAVDVPVVVDDRSLLMRAAKVQKANNSEMMEVLRGLNSHVELVNVGHGMTYEHQIEYAEAVDEPSCRRIAFGDIYRTSVFESVYLLTRLLYKLKDRYDHFHVLGVYNLTLLPAIILMANKYPIKHMTSDASTHLQSGINKMYHHQVLPETPMRRIPIGSKGGQGSRLVSSSHKVLPCSCPVCSSIKYFDIFGQLEGSMLSFSLAQHNLFEITRYVKFMNAMARDLTRKQYTDLVIGQLSNKSAATETLNALNFIYETAESENPVKSGRKYSMYLAKGLFAPPVVSQVLFGEVEQDTSIESLKAKVEVIIDKYEKHHNEAKVKTAKKKQEGGKGKKVVAMFSKKKKINSKGLKGERVKNKKKAKTAT